jgi:penicillin amidase
MFSGTVLVTGGYGFYSLKSSLPAVDKLVAAPSIHGRVNVSFDDKGIPGIFADTREEAYFALGLITARDRLFQMDLLRRRSAGRLAEIFGPGVVEADKEMRTMGFEQLASDIVARLPFDQSQALRFYANGVNRAIEEFAALPFEFTMLGYRPEPWRPEDSILVVLGMYVVLGGDWEAELSTTIMHEALPKPVFEFLTPRLDPHTEKMLGEPADVMNPPLPVKELVALLAKGDRDTTLSYTPAPPHGSNGWVVGPSRTRDGRAILANDMHLDLGVPNIWYRAELHYRDVDLVGITLPGVPLMISGSNGHIAWGFTGSGIDVLDLVLVEVDPQDASRYKAEDGWHRFDLRDEVIRVKGAPDEALTVRSTVWGPILPARSFDKTFALRWVALDAAATDLELLDLDRVTTAQAALDLLNRAGGPILNALVADAQGNIGWTLTGRIPVRFGLDGLVSRSWADGTRGWQGYLAPADVPRRLNPPEGFIVNANQKMMGRDHPRVPANDAAPGYRAFRIRERLREMRGITEKDMLDLQLDTRGEAYRYYRDLAVEALRKQAETAETAAVRRYLEAWDGRAEPESLGLALLVEFRRALLEEVLFPILGRCRQLDPSFEYRWIYPDVPLQRLLDARHPELLPNRQYGDWDSLIREILVREARRLVAAHGVDRIDALTWGVTDRELIAHPLSQAVPLLGHLLDMPRQPLPGCPYCVRAARGGGATERLVVSPGREQDGLFQMPGGQSGHPLSPHYGDQHEAWVRGLATPLLAGEPAHRLVLMPSAVSSSSP